MSKISTLLLSGGGLRGIAYCGVFKRLHELNAQKVISLDVKKVAGVSAGSIFGLGYVLGYSPEEMEEEVLNKNFNMLKDVKISNLIKKYGIDSGNNMISWIETMLIKKGFDRNITFEELYNKNPIELMIFATNLNNYNFTVFNHINTPHVKVTKAIRCSISIPLVFTAEIYDNNIHVDGGVVNNYPIHYFESNDLLGIKLVSHGEKIHEDKNHPIKDIYSYVFNVISCFLVQREKQTHSKQANTIYVHTEGMNHTVNFSISLEDKKQLIEDGYNATKEYFNKCVNSGKEKINDNCKVSDEQCIGQV